MDVSGHYLDPKTSEPLELRKNFVSDIKRQYRGHYIKTGVDYDLSDKIAFGTYGFYSGKMIEGQTIVKPLWTISFGVRKNLFNDKFSMYIYAQDIFHSIDPRVTFSPNS
ncbi:MAG: outer membrane beta-barrel family protein [Tannerellaceae bacterium]|nr:outer membrane beta-barrel family protein [Tannerellaceae bacterium]